MLCKIYFSFGWQGIMEMYLRVNGYFVDIDCFKFNTLGPQ